MSILFWRLLNYLLNHSCSEAKHYGLCWDFSIYGIIHFLLLRRFVGLEKYKKITAYFFWLPQVLKYLDYVFTGVFTFEMVIKVNKITFHLFLELCNIKSFGF